MRRGALEAVEPEIRLLSEAPDLKQQYEAWNHSRLAFNADLKQPGSQAHREKWQKLYQQGLRPDHTAASVPGHRTRLRLKAFSAP